VKELEEIEIICRGILQKTMSRANTISQIAPEAPSADYLSGHGAGHLEGQASVAALVLSLIKGESATQILEEARSAAAVDAAFPFDLHMDIDGTMPAMEEVPPEQLAAEARTSDADEDG
jgi:hypothetical protein